MTLDKNILTTMPFAVTFDCNPEYGDVSGTFYRELEVEAEEVYINCCLSDAFTNVQLHKPSNYERTN